MSIPQTEVTLPVPHAANQFVLEHGLTDTSEVRSIVKQSLDKLDNVHGRLDALENKGWFKRVLDGLSGKTQKEQNQVMRDLSEVQQWTIQLVLSLATYHSRNLHVMAQILDELGQGKQTYTRLASHCELLYGQVAAIKEQAAAQIETEQTHQRKARSIALGLRTLVVIGVGILVVGLAILIVLLRK